jgi:hypothetical protein
MLMMLTHSVVSGAMARTSYPTVALAAYSASYSIVAVLESPIYGMGRMCLTFTQGRKSFRKAGQVTFMVLGVLLLVLAVICWTPVSGPVFKGMLGVSEEVYKMAVPSMRVLMLWPIWSAFRSVFQVPIVIKKQTVWLTINMVVRVIVMFIAAAILPGLWPVGPVGASILMLGLAAESLLALVASSKIIGPLEEETPDKIIPRSAVLLKFGLPLAIASSVQTLGRPIITASLSKTINPEVALAGYQVATSFSFIFTSLTYNIYQLVVVYVKDKDSFKQIRTFSVVLGTMALACLWISSVPQIGTWIFGSIIKVPQEVVPEALKAVASVAMMPFFASLAECFGGILMLSRQAVWVTVAKSGNMLASSLLVITLARFCPVMGAAIGAISLAAGSGVEALICWLMVRRLPVCRQLL